MLVSDNIFNVELLQQALGTQEFGKGMVGDDVALIDPPDTLHRFTSNRGPRLIVCWVNTSEAIPHIVKRQRGS
ncbi:hypothetical protein OS128_11850 [Corynebacterium sp. P5848]|uniref:hypothetical protein n=1 Tax=Corynebacterium marambiense TaxID=2765364 RepID=UPI0022609AE9|nr:hypothetical protein [Corynebacterium marambiense]MCX7543599.1 hypothetical protein [Corynebacterium marambiense]